MSSRLPNQSRCKIRFRLMDKLFWKLQAHLHRIQVKRDKKELKRKSEIIKNSCINNKVPLSRKDGSHCRFIPQILPVHLNIYFPHTDKLLDFHMSPVNGYNIFCSCLCDCVFFVLDASLLQSVLLSWKADHIAL